MGAVITRTSLSTALTAQRGSDILETRATEYAIKLHKKVGGALLKALVGLEPADDENRINNLLGALKNPNTLVLTACVKSAMKTLLEGKDSQSVAVFYDGLREDSEKTTSLVIQTMLKQLQIRVVVASNGQRVLKKTKEGTP